MGKKCSETRYTLKYKIQMVTKRKNWHLQATFFTCVETTGWNLYTRACAIAYRSPTRICFISLRYSDRLTDGNRHRKIIDLRDTSKNPPFNLKYWKNCGHDFRYFLRNRKTCRKTIVVLRRTIDKNFQCAEIHGINTNRCLKAHRNVESWNQICALSVFTNHSEGNSIHQVFVTY